MTPCTLAVCLLRMSDPIMPGSRAPCGLQSCPCCHPGGRHAKACNSASTLQSTQKAKLWTQVEGLRGRCFGSPASGRVMWLQHLCRSAGVVLSIDGENGMWELRRREDSHGPQSPACKTCTPHSRGPRQWLLTQCCGQPRWCSQQATALPRRWHQRLNGMAGPSWSEAPWQRSLCRSMTSSITQPAAALLQHWRQRLHSVAGSPWPQSPAPAPCPPPESASPLA